MQKAVCEFGKCLGSKQRKHTGKAMADGDAQRRKMRGSALRSRFATAEMTAFGAKRKCRHGSLSAAIRSIPENMCSL